MAAIATLAVNLTANASNFKKGMDDAGKSLDNFVLKEKDVKQASRSIVGAFGSNGNAAIGFIHSLVEFGPVVGMVVGGFEILASVLKTTAEDTKNNNENAAFLAETYKNLGMITGSIKPPGFFETDTQNQIENINQQLLKMEQESQAVSDNWFAGGSQIRKLSEDMSKLRDEQTKLLKIQQKTRPGSQAIDQFEEDDFNTKYSTATGSWERDIQNVSNMEAKVRALGVQLNALPVGGTKYIQTQKELRLNTLKLLDLEDALAMRRKKYNTDGGDPMFTKIMEMNVELMQKANEKTKEFAKTLKEDIKTPFEKFEDYIKKMQAAFNMGEIDTEQWAIAMKEAEEKVQAEIDKGKKEKKEKKDGGAFKSIDTSLISVEGLKGRGKEEKKDPQLAITNKLLMDIKGKLGVLSGPGMTI